MIEVRKQRNRRGGIDDIVPLWTNRDKGGVCVRGKEGRGGEGGGRIGISIRLDKC